MPVKQKWDLVCIHCGRHFTLVTGDAIMPNEKNKLEHPVCKICNAKIKIKIKIKGGK